MGRARAAPVPPPQDSATVPPAASHSSLVMDFHPCPLHAFCPWHAEDAVAQSEVPLHEFTPLQWTLASPPSAADATGAEANSAAALVANSSPDNFLPLVIAITSRDGEMTSINRAGLNAP